MSVLVTPTFFCNDLTKNQKKMTSESDSSGYVPPFTYLFTAESVRMVAIGDLMFFKSHTLTVRSSLPETTLSPTVNTADVTVLQKMDTHKKKRPVVTQRMSYLFKLESEVCIFFGSHCTPQTNFSAVKRVDRKVVLLPVLPNQKKEKEIFTSEYLFIASLVTLSHRR